MHLLKKHWSIFFIIFVSFLICLLNYTPHTYLAGWDNLMPEFAPQLNFWRSIFGIWQDYRGLGYSDGMSHAAETIHTLVIWLLTCLFPLSIVRYIFVFITYISGGLGAWFLLNKFIPQFTKYGKMRTVVMLIGTFYYLFNYATIQTFIVPFEPFVIQYAVLPWLLFGLLNYLDTPSKKTYILFFILTVVASAQYFVPTLFAGTTGLFIFTLLPLLFTKRNDKWKVFLVVLITYFIANFYWLIPYISTLPHTSQVIKNAKFNEMSSQNVILNNRQRGDLLDVLTLRGYVLDTNMPNQAGVFSYFIMSVQKHADSILGVLAGLYMPAMALFTLWKKKTTFTKLEKAGVGGLFIFTGFCLFILSSRTIGVSALQEYLRNAFPIVSEAFRDPFTKFRIPFAISIMLLASTGLWQLSQSAAKVIFRVFIGMATASIIYMAVPFAAGYFIHPYMRIQIPSSYLDLNAYMQTQPIGRIATFPQTTFWSWRVTNYGYTGSGFVWYGLLQPTMDRSFDPWSRENENYYWEITYALYKKDPELLKSVLSKYDINYVLVDKYQGVLFGRPRALYANQLNDLLGETGRVKSVTQFGELILYSLNLDPKWQVKIENAPPTIGKQYSYGDYDAAFQKFGYYISSKDKNPDIYFPFRPLFSKRGPLFSDVNINEDNRYIHLQTKLPITLSDYRISSRLEKVDVNSQTASISATIEKEKALRFTAIVGLTMQDNQAVDCDTGSQGNASVRQKREGGVDYIRFIGENRNACLNVEAPNLEQKRGYVVAITNRHLSGKPLLISFSNITAQHTEMDEYTSTGNEWHTDYFILPALAHDGLGYYIYFTNESKGYIASINDVKDIRIYEFPYSELSSLHFQKKGINGFKNITSVNNQNINLVSIDNPNPAYYQVTYKQVKSTTGKQTLVLSQAYDEGWKAYKVKIQNSKVKSAIQKYLPFIFGKEIKEHVLVNNWSNGWLVENKCNMEHVTYNNQSNPQNATCYMLYVIFFWPQYLEFIGFGLLILTFGVILLLPGEGRRKLSEKQIQPLKDKGIYLKKSELAAIAQATSEVANGLLE